MEKKGNCNGGHCKCMNLDKSCSKFHNGDHDCIYGNAGEHNFTHPYSAELKPTPHTETDKCACGGIYKGENIVHGKSRCHDPKNEKPSEIDILEEFDAEFRPLFEEEYSNSFSLTRDFLRHAISSVLGRVEMTVGEDEVYLERNGQMAGEERAQRNAKIIGINQEKARIRAILQVEKNKYE